MGKLNMAVLDALPDDKPDPDEFVRAAMAWHFDEDTGCQFWLDRAKSLDFDPRTDVHAMSDLALFPNVTDELREVPIERLIPAGFGPHPDVVGIIESGGTTGAPKRLPLLREFADKMTLRDVAGLQEIGVASGMHWLMIFPSGPHGALEQGRRTAKALESLVFAVDMDPRWVKKQTALGRFAEADAYAEHLVDQAAYVLRHQHVSLLRATAPILTRIAERDDLVQLIRDKIRFIHWGGASMDTDTRHLLRNDIFPQAVLTGGYGTTMALGSGATERPASSDEDPCIFDPHISPYTTFTVVNPDTAKTVEFGERGQLVVNHLSKSFLLPNNRERDSVLRIEPVSDQVGDSIADIQPVDTFDGERVIEGVY